MLSSSALFESIFKQPFSASGNAELLSSVAREHPCFSPAQFFLLQKTEPGTEAERSQAAKTALVFNNPHWLNFQLKYGNSGPAILQGKEMPEITETAGENTGKDDDSVVAEKETVIPVMNTTEPVPIPQPITAGQIEADNTDNNDDEALMEPGTTPMRPILKTEGLNAPLPADMPLFEPMHMVDYFASQGIKLSEEVMSADKLGKQLKSFTEWLKTMKKVHPAGEEPSPVQSSGQNEAAIQSLAEKSNKDDEVITESMAEVFAKQGKTGKAIELYGKLSLLDPSKIAYFAAKIEQLKGL